MDFNPTIEEPSLELSYETEQEKALWVSMAANHQETMRPSQLKLPMRKRLSTFNFLMTCRPLLNQSYGVDLSILFLSMDPSSTSHQTPRTSKSPSTSWPNISRTNKLMVVRLTNSTISMI